MRAKWAVFPDPITIPNLYSDLVNSSNLICPSCDDLVSSGNLICPSCNLYNDLVNSGNLICPSCNLYNDLVNSSNLFCPCRASVRLSKLMWGNLSSSPEPPWAT